MVLLQLCLNLDTLDLELLDPDIFSTQFVELLLHALKTDKYTTFDNLREISLSDPTSDIFSVFERCPALRSLLISFSADLLKWQPYDRSVQVAQLRTLTLMIYDGLYLSSFLHIAGHFPRLASLSIEDHRTEEAPDRANVLWVRRKKRMDQRQRLLTTRPSVPILLGRRQSYGA
jgi:hypothetical protein